MVDDKDERMSDLTNYLRNGVQVIEDRWPGNDGYDFRPDISGASSAMREAADALEAQEARIAELEQRITLVSDLTQSVIACPQGSLWNYGTHPTAKDKLEWAARADLAGEVYSLISVPDTGDTP